MRVLSDWRLRGLLGLALVAGGLGWMNSQQLPDSSSLDTLIRQALPARLQAWINPAPVPAPVSLADYGRLPLQFEPNVGQAHRDVKYLARGAGYSLLLTPDEAVFHLSRPRALQQSVTTMPDMESTVLRAQLVGANQHATIHGENKLQGSSNYFIGNDSHHWHTDVANYQRVRYEAVWPGVDLVYYGNQSQLEYDFVVQPGTNPDVIRLSYKGADKLRIDAAGNLLAETALGPVLQRKPVVYQTIAGIRHPVAGEFALANQQVGFALGAYDHSQPLVIDPVLVYSSYLGGGSADKFNMAAIAVTATGSSYVTGYTDSAVFPTQSPYQAARKATYTAFVSKFANSGKSLAYSSYLGGSSNGRALAIAVDADGNAWVGGHTIAADFPLVSAFQSTGNSAGSGFLSKLSSDGQQLLYSTFFGGQSGTAASGEMLNSIRSVALDGSGAPWVAGSTSSTDFPLQNARQALHGGAGNAQTGFISHFTVNGDALQFSSYFGGSGKDIINGLVLAAGDVFVAGTTISTDFPGASVSNQLNGGLNGTAADGFLARLSADGQTLRYARYFGGSSDDSVYGLAADSTGKAWLAGGTSSTSADFPLPNNSSENSKSDSIETAFLASFDGSGINLFSTYMGSAGRATGVALDSQQRPYVAGQMKAAFTLLSPVRNAGNAPTDANNGFVRLYDNSNTLVFSTDLGGSSSDDSINGIALDAADAIYVAGETRSTDLPTLNNDPVDGVYSSDFVRSGFVSKIASGPAITLTISPGTVAVNGSSTISWSAPEASSCSWDDTGASALTGTRNESHSVADSFTYTLRCTDANGTTAESITQLVVPAPTITFTLSPATISLGQSTTLAWTSSNASACSLSVDGTVNTVAVNYSTSFTPTAVNSGDLILSCYGPGSASPASQTRTLTVIAAPSVTLRATTSSSPVLVGDSVTYTWSSANDIASCSATGVISGNVASSGSQAVTMTAAGEQSMTLTCTGNTGATATQTVSVHVLDPGQPPDITFSAVSNSFKLYGSTTLNWSASNASSCTASGDWSGSKTLSNSLLIRPDAVRTYDYTLNCSNPGMSASQTVHVDVTMPDPAEVAEFTATPSTIPLGATTTLNWRAINSDPNACVASGADGWSGNKPIAASRTLTPTVTGTLQLTLTCTGAAGTDSKTISVTVTPAASSGGGSSSNSSGGSSGGPVDLALLLGLGALGLLRRPVAKR